MRLPDHPGQAMRILLLSSDTRWTQCFVDWVKVTGWSVVTVRNIEEFRGIFVDSEFDVLLAESLLGADLIETMCHLREQSARCGVVWLHDEQVFKQECLDYSKFADRRALKSIALIELNAVLISLMCMLKRYGWR